MVTVPRPGLCEEEGFYLIPGSHVAVGSFCSLVSLLGTIYHVSEGARSIYFIKKPLKNQKPDPLVGSILAEMAFPSVLELLREGTELM